VPPIPPPPGQAQAPRFAPLPLVCIACGAAFDMYQPVNAPIATWAAHVRTFSCVRCGAGAERLAVRAGAP
jgi:hypothetical protein